MDATFYMEKAVFNYRVAAIMIVDNHVLIHGRQRTSTGHCQAEGSSSRRIHRQVW